MSKKNNNRNKKVNKTTKNSNINTKFEFFSKYKKIFSKKYYKSLKFSFLEIIFIKAGLSLGTGFSSAGSSKPF